MYLARVAFLALMAAATSVPAYASETAWVASERLNRRTCPDTNCGAVGQFFYREGVQILEKRGGWARVTKYYDESCYNGRSAYVDAGNAACSTIRATSARFVGNSVGKSMEKTPSGPFVSTVTKREKS